MKSQTPETRRSSALRRWFRALRALAGLDLSSPRRRVCLGVERLEDVEAANNLMGLGPALAGLPLTSAAVYSEAPPADVVARHAEETETAAWWPTTSDAARSDLVFTQTAAAVSSGGDVRSSAGTDNVSPPQPAASQPKVGDGPLDPVSAVAGALIDPLSNPSPASSGQTKAGPRGAGTPAGNGVSTNPPASALLGGGLPGGASTPFAGGGGGGTGGGGSAPVGGPLATLANEGAFGPAVVHASGSAAPAKMQDVNPSSPPGSPPPPASQLTGNSTTISATEGGLTNYYYWNSSVGDSPLIKGTAGVALSNVTVATFGDNNPLSVPGDFTATIDWGDNTTSSGSIAASQGGGFAVTGSHTYAVAGNYNVTVSIAEASSGTTTATASTIAAIQDTAITATPVSVSATENTALNNVTVATFTDADASEPAADLSAVIDWGDGTGTSTGTVTGGNGNFTVTGSHTYTEGGTFQPVVTITSQGGSSAAVQGTATVADLPLTGTQLTLTPAVTGASTTLAASFTDGNTTEAPNNYMAQINWGDGSTADDATVNGSSGSYNLNGSHVYDHPGGYTVTVTVTDAGGATLTQTANVTISAAGMSAAGTTLTATAGQAISGAQIASFTDGNTDDMNDSFGPASGYTVTIDWGDGSGPDSGATIDGDPSGFYVLGTHTYANTGAYTATVTITNADGVSTSTTSTVDVTTITPTGATVSASEGVAANNATVATFTDTQPGTYTASIDWGDGGTPTTGTVSGSGGSYTVTGSHTYADGGTYPVTATITNAQGLTSVATGTANVADAALVATPQAIVTPQNSPLNNVTVATFTDANTQDSVGSYSASIDWGDGSPTDEGTVNVVNGVYTVTGSHLYTTQGVFNVAVSIGDAGGSTTTANSTATVSSPVISASPAGLSAQVGVALTNATVATFTAPGLAGDYTATIDWGDGTTGSGTVSGTAGSFSVTGSHTYSQPTDGQPYLLTVTITDTSGDVATALGSATVDGGSVAAVAANPTVAEQSQGMITLATFTDTDPSYSAGEFTATVDWGDGTQDVVAVSGYNGTYSVMGSHAYAEEGNYTVTISITDPNGVAVPALTETMVVTDATLSASSAWVYATQGVALQNVEVATFTDQDAFDPATNYTATINWGDGSSSAGTVSGANGGFSVSGSHTYSQTGNFTIQVTISDAGGSQATASDSVSVNGAANYYVGSFSDSNSNDTAGQFQATINWGDGSPTSSGTIMGQSGVFYINGVHAYAEDGSYAVTVTVTGPGGPLTINSTAQVAEAPLLGSQSPPSPPQAPPPAPQIPKISFDFTSGGFGGLLMNARAASQPGLRIHIDDDFFSLKAAPNNPGSVLADNLQTSIVLPGFNTNLVRGTLTVGPAGSEGTLVWSIPNSVRVWWQRTPNSPWQDVQSGGLPIVPNFKATGQTIPIVIQGITPFGGDAANVSVEYTIGKGTPASASFFYTVYTGLIVSGAQNPQQKLINQLQQASGYGLTVDNSGNVWRTSMSELAANQAQVHAFQQSFDPILVNTGYRTYQNEKPSTLINAISVVDNTPGIPDSYDLKSLYPDNIAAISAGLKDDGPKFAAALLIHPLQEQFQHQVNEVPFTTDQKGKPDVNKGGAFGAGVTAEQSVLGWGTRLGTITNNAFLGPGQFANEWKIQYTDPTTMKVTVVILLFDTKTYKFKSAELKRPGQ